MPASLTARAPLVSETDTHWWTFTARTSGTYEVRLGDLPQAYRLTVHYPGGSSSSASSSTADRVRTVTLAAGARLDIAISSAYGGFDPARAYRLAITPPASAGAMSDLLIRVMQQHD